MPARRRGADAHRREEGNRRSPGGADARTRRFPAHSAGRQQSLVQCAQILVSLEPRRTAARHRPRGSHHLGARSWTGHPGRVIAPPFRALLPGAHGRSTIGLTSRVGTRAGDLQGCRDGARRADRGRERDRSGQHVLRPPAARRGRCAPLNFPSNAITLASQAAEAYPRLGKARRRGATHPMLDRTPARHALRAHIAIGLVSCAVLLYEIAITRVLSVVLWYHFAFLAVSMAMLGLGAPGAWFALRRPSDRALPVALVLAGLVMPLSLVALFKGSEIVRHEGGILP